jgi:hypothetical protein
MIKETITLYTFEELSEDAQNEAINETIEAWCECEAFVPDDAKEGFEKAIKDSERMQTPWFLGSYVWEYCQQQIKDECRTAYYWQNGKFYKWME